METSNYIALSLNCISLLRFKYGVMKQDNNDKIRDLFRRVYSGRINPMTPNVIRYGVSGEFAYELSKGTFMNHTLYGITIIEIDNEEPNHIFSKCCFSLSEAEEYISVIGDINPNSSVAS